MKLPKRPKLKKSGKLPEIKSRFSKHKVLECNFPKEELPERRYAGRCEYVGRYAVHRWARG